MATNLELTDEQTEALIRKLSHIVESDPYPFSPRIGMLRDILAPAATPTDMRALAITEAVSAAASDGSEKATAGLGEIRAWSHQSAWRTKGNGGGCHP